MTSLWNLVIVLATLSVRVSSIVGSSEIDFNLVESEMFSIPITPNMFNWTYQEFDKQYRFRTTLLNKPELPGWIRYVYSERHHSGFIFGTPLKGTKSPTTLEIIGLNRQDYETRRLLMNLTITPKVNPSNHEVQLKIDNLNVEDLLDQHRMVRLREIFTIHLWPESSEDLHATFLASALEFGGRLPLIPTQGEGLVVRLGSRREFSTELKRLRDEVKPLLKLTHCPRDYKRTTVERLFREHFTIDWCTFKLYKTKYTKKAVQLTEYVDDTISTTPVTFTETRDNPERPWTAPSSGDIPVRSYLAEAFISLTVPVLLLVLCITALSAVLCCHFVDGTEQKFRCQYDTSESRDTIGSTSERTPSRNRLFSPKSLNNLASAYNRPEPPPYNSASTTNRKNGKSSSEMSSTTPELAPKTLEESLRLIEEANIANNQQHAKTWFC